MHAHTHAGLNLASNAFLKFQTVRNETLKYMEHKSISNKAVFTRCGSQEAIKVQQGWCARK